MADNVRGQLVLHTGWQRVTCDCGKEMSVRVGARRVDDRHRSYKPYHGECRTCGNVYDGVLLTIDWSKYGKK